MGKQVIYLQLDVIEERYIVQGTKDRNTCDFTSISGRKHEFTSLSILGSSARVNASHKEYIFDEFRSKLPGYVASFKLNSPDQSAAHFRYVDFSLLL